MLIPLIARFRAVLFALLLMFVNEIYAEPSGRVLNFEYHSVIGALDAGVGPVPVFIPLAVAGEQPCVVSERI